MEMEMEMEMEIAKDTRCGTIICVLNQKIPTSSSSSSLPTTAMVKMEMETEMDPNHSEKRVKQPIVRQHFSHAHHWPPQQQYKSKKWTIVIILKLTFVAWDSWTYQIGY